uniref:Uncharacterized protein n=1 Tax=Cacopsylla melanoneura TaxID=428564 RepID=A0A8D8X7K7_9HEMI
MSIIDIINSIEDGLKLNLKCSCRLKYAKIIYLFTVFTPYHFISICSTPKTLKTSTLYLKYLKIGSISRIFSSRLLLLFSFFFLSPFSFCSLFSFSLSQFQCPEVLEFHQWCSLVPLQPISPPIAIRHYAAAHFV